MIDIIVITLYFLIVPAFGLWIGRRETTLHEFALAKREIPWWAVLVSIIAAETSAATFLGTPGEAYTNKNFLYIQMGLGLILGRVIAAFLFIKPYYELNVYSIYEYMEKRFGVWTKNATSLLFLITRSLAMGARLYVAAIVIAVLFKIVLNRPLTTVEELLIYIVSVVFILILTTLYTAIGGIKAVIWTDLIQATVMFGGGLTALLYLYFKIPNGLIEIESIIGNLSVSHFINFSFDFKTPYTFWSGVLGMTFLTMSTHGTDQDMVQRMLTAKNYRHGRISSVLSGLADLPILLIFLSIGICLYVFYINNPDQNLPQKPNEIFSYFILKELPPGVRGVVIAGIFATAMGSLSTALNALATSFLRNWYVPYFSKSSDETFLVRKTKVFTVYFAIIMLLIASATSIFVIYYPSSRIIPLVLGIIGYTYGSMLGVFLLGALTKTRGSDKTNIIAMVLGIIVVTVISHIPAPIAFPWRIMVGTLITFTFAVLFGKKQNI